MGCFLVDFQEVKRPLRTKSVKRPIKVGKRPINEGKRPIKAMVLVGISVGCLIGCFRASRPWWKTAPLKRPIKRSMRFLGSAMGIAIANRKNRCDFGALSSKIALTKARLLKHDFPVHGLVLLFLGLSVSLVFFLLRNSLVFLSIFCILSIRMARKILNVFEFSLLISKRPRQRRTGIARDLKSQSRPQHRSRIASQSAWKSQLKSLAIWASKSSLRAQRLKNFKILKISSEIENFKRAAHQTPIFCGEFWRSGLKFSSEIEIFKRDWKVQSRLNFFNLWALRVWREARSTFCGAFLSTPFAASTFQSTFSAIFPDRGLGTSPVLPFLVFLEFLVFFPCEESLFFWAFFLSFPGILGVRRG